MATVLEELLIKIGIDVDSDILKNVEDVNKRVAKGADNAAKSITKQRDALRLNGKAADKRQSQERAKSKTDKDGLKDQAKSNVLTEKYLGFVKGIAKIAPVAIITGIASAFNKYSSALSETGAENSKFSREVGISSEALQAAQFAAERENISAEEMTGILATLNSAIGELMIGGGPQGGMSMLGLSAQKANGELKTSLDLMLDIIDATSGLSPQVRAQRLGALGVPQLARAAGGGRRPFEAQMGEALAQGLESQEAMTAAENLGDAQQDAANAWRETTEESRKLLTETKTAFSIASKFIAEEFAGKRTPETSTSRAFSQGQVYTGGIFPSIPTDNRSEVNINVKVEAQTSDERKIGEAVKKATEETIHRTMDNKEGGFR